MKIFEIVSRRKYALAFVFGLVLPSLDYVFVFSQPELEKVREGLLGGIMQGAMMGLSVIIPMLLLYAMSRVENAKRSMVKPGLILSTFAGMLLISPFTSVMKGYPALWSFTFFPTTLVVIVVAYHMLYRLHFRTCVK